MQKFSPPLFRHASLCFSLRTIYQNKNKTKQTRPRDLQNKWQIQMIYVIKPRTPKKDPWLVCMFVFCTVVKFKKK